MKIDKLLVILSSKHIKLTSNAGKLEFHAPEGAITPEIFQLIKDHKQKLLTLLDQHYNRLSVQSIPIEPIDRSKNLPISFSQERLLFLNHFKGDKDISHNIPWNLRLAGNLNVHVLKISLNTIIQRHESLRTIFRTKNGIHTQIIKKSINIDIPIINVLDNNIDDLINNFVTHVFDLHQGPLIKIEILHLSPEEHILLLNIHHIIADGWSLTILLNEIKHWYCFYSQDQLSPLPKLTIQYVDFAKWQQQCLNSKILNRQLQYWKKQFEDIPLPLLLPFDYPRKKHQRFHGRTVRFHLPSNLYQNIKKISRSEESSLFITLLTGFYILLLRYSGQSDICVGTPIANRQRQELNKIIGFFANTLPLRIKIKPEMTVLNFLRQVKEMVLSTFSNQDIPFEKIVKIAKPERNTRNSPLFQTMFSLQNVTQKNFKFSNISAELLETETFTAKFDITMTLTESNHGISGELEYDVDLFDQKTIEKFCSHFKKILESMVHSPEKKLSEINFFFDSERLQLLLEWNNTKIDYPENCCIHTLIERQVNTNPNAIAVLDNKIFLTYEKLNKLSNQLAHYLIEKGIGPEKRVILCIERSINMLIGLLAILKAGGAYVPIDTNNPKKRIEYIVKDSGATLILTHSEYTKTLFDKINISCFSFDECATKIKHNPDTNPQTTVIAKNLLYVIYTSGSTGVPKAVMLEHSSFVNHMMWMVDTFRLKSNDKILQKTPLSFDASGWEWALPLITGCQLILAKANAHLDSDYLLDIINKQNITVFQATPSLLCNIVDESTIKKIKSLRYLFSGGEPLSIELYNHLRNICNRANICNLYGTTETAIDNTYHVFDPKNHPSKVVIGKPINNTKIYVLDDHYNPTPIGVIGEMYIAGNGVSRGYLGDPVLTAQQFVPNPFSDKIGERLYKSNDLAKYHCNGNIEYIQRKDQQINIRGARIEPAEIERAITKQAGVEQVTVVCLESPYTAHKFQKRQYHLAAYVVYKNTSITNTEILRQHIQNSLPEYMIPTIIIPLEKLPLTKTGKLDKNALPLINKNIFNTPSLLPANTKTEKKLTLIWSELLAIPVKNIGIQDNFFSLGGHSLLLFKIINQIYSHFHINIPLRDIFDKPTIESISASIDKTHSKNSNYDKNFSSIIPIKNHKNIPLSFSQRRMWFINQIDDRFNIKYNMPRSLLLIGKLHTSALKKSLQYIVDRHESLRSIFPAVGENTIQVVNPTLTIKLPIQQITENELPKYLHDNTNHIFELSKGPLIHIQLLRLSTEKHVLQINMHHIIADGYSVDIFDKELSVLYQTYLKSEAPKLTALPIQYKDFTLWQHSWMTGKVLEDHRNYWKNKLKNLQQFIDVPTDKQRLIANSDTGSHELFRIPKTISQPFKQLCLNQNCTLFSGFMSVFKVLLYRLSGNQDISVATVTACRQRSELENLIGCFVNTLILRDKIDNKILPFVNFMQQVQKTSTEALLYQAMPFDSIVDMLKPERIPGMLPLAQILMDFQIIEKKTLDLIGLSSTEINGKIQKSKFDLSLCIRKFSNDFEYTIEYKTQLFSRSTIQHFSSVFQTLLADVVNNPYKCINNLAVLSDSNHHKILSQWNNTKQSLSNNYCIHELVELQAKLRPDTIALVYQGEKFSYKYLNELSNQFSHYLIKHNIKPETYVGLHLNRSPVLIIALLGVLKAGGAYIPIPADTPSKRLVNLCNNAKLKFLITHTALIKSFTHLINNKNILHIDNIFSVLKKYKRSNPQVDISSDNLAYIVYTSGSTGEPKGVTITHKSVINLCKWHQNNFNVDERSKGTQLASIGFDAMAWEVWPYLTAGAELNFLHSEIYLSTDIFIIWLTNKNITHCFTPTLIAEKLLTENWPKKCNLLFLFTGGDALKVTAQKHLPFQLINNYGPTEATVVTTSGKNSTQLSTQPSIGRPINNTAVYILDKQLNPVPIGVVGELYISGNNLARCYLYNSKLTADKFIPNPYSIQTGDRLYKSGDFAKYKTNGEIDFVGRSDQQINIRGIRVELGEIEAAILQHPSIKNCVTVVQKNTFSDYILVAYVTINSNSTLFDKKLLTSKLREFLLDKLLSFMIPNYYVKLDEIPLTISGKIDKKSLPATEFSLTAIQNNKQHITKIEKKLILIWEEILEIPPATVGIDDSFFALGGHSLLATTLVNKIKKTMNIPININHIFDSNTIRNLAKLIEKLIKEKHFSENSTIKYSLNTHKFSDRHNTFPQSFAQQRLWFLNQQRGTTDTSYNICKAIRLSGNLDTNSLTKALRTIIQRHDSLRTTFKTEKNKNIQIISTQSLYDISVIDLPESKLSAYLKRINNYVFDLTNGPLIIVELLQHSPQQYTLLFNLHHIICDGWSMGIIEKETMIIYNAFINGKNPDLPTLSFQYSKFSLWQHQCLQDNSFKRQLDFWKNQLDGAPTILDMPTDYPKNNRCSNNGDTVNTTFSLSLSKQIKQLAQQEGCTVFMTLLAGFTILLARYSGQDDICVGTPVANRQRTEFEAVVGLFVNTLVLRTKLDVNITFRTLLHQIKSTTLAAFSHQDAPFERVVEALNPKRTPYHTPLFQVLFSFHNTPSVNFELPGTTTSTIDDTITTTLFDLSIILFESDDKISAAFQYNTNLYKQSTIKRLLMHYQILLERLTYNPQLKLANISELSTSDRQKILKQWNNTTSQLKNKYCVHEYFEIQAEKTPLAIAVINQHDKITYEELNKRSNRLAHYLIEQGIGPDIPVGICMERSIEQLVALIAILKAGGAYVPIDPQYPCKRINYILNDCQCPLILSQKKLHRKLFSEHNIPILCIDNQSSGILSDNNLLYRDTNITLRCSAQNIVSIIYTSGSTGKPKGVMTTHGALQNHMSWMNSTFQFQKSDKFLHKTPLIFDAAGWEWAIPLITGAQLILAEMNAHRDPERLLQLIASNNITIVQVTPSLLNHLLKHPNSSTMQSLRYLFTGGENLSTHLYRAFEVQTPTAVLCNLYGPTETTIDSTYWISKSCKNSASVAIGKPISNTQVYILDKYLNPVAIGVKGEIFIAGSGLARGYINNPLLTAEKFIPNCFSNEKGSRLYQTGDFARFLPDGTIEFISRADHQVKIHGLRIELNEIEQTLLKHTNIKEAAVVIHNVDQNQKIAAYIVTSKHENIDQTTLQSYLLTSLPEYMLPTSFNYLNKLPLTASGKIDRYYLSTKISTNLYKNLTFTIQTETEKCLIKIWASILKLDTKQITPTDDFFDLGGHSLLATQLINQIRKYFSITITIRDLFTAPTIKQLACVVDTNIVDTNTANNPKMDKIHFRPIKVINKDRAPLSSNQLRLWFIYRYNQQDNHLYNIPSAFNLQGKIQLSQLQKAFQIIVNRHDSLRTAFQKNDGIVSQVIADHVDCNISIVESTKSELSKTLLKLYSVSFDLSSCPLFAFTIIRLSTKEHILVINMHHIITDGWSIAVILRELSIIYKCLVNNEDLSLEPLSIRYIDFVCWQSNQKKNRRRSAHYRYWQHQLTNVKYNYNFPEISKSKTEKRNPVHSTCKFTFSSQLNSKIIQLSQSNNVTLFSTLITGFTLLLARYSNQNDICILFDEAHRQYCELDQIVGFFANTLVLRTKLKKHNTLNDLLKATQSTLLSAIEHQEISFDNLLKIVNPAHKKGQNSTFQVAFGFQRTANKLLTLPNIRVSPLSINNIGVKVDLGMNIIESAHSISGVLSYNSHRFSSSFIENFCHDYTQLLKEITETTQIPHSVFSD